jgi:hypothetical protein
MRNLGQAVLQATDMHHLGARRQLGLQRAVGGKGGIDEDHFAARGRIQDGRLRQAGGVQGGGSVHSENQS